MEEGGIDIKKYFVDVSNFIGFIISMFFGILLWIILPQEQVSIYIAVSLAIIIAILAWFIAIYIYKSKEELSELEKELNSYRIFNNIPYPNVIRFNNRNNNLICFIRESRLFQQDNLYTLYYQCDDEQIPIGLLKVILIQTDGICQSIYYPLHDIDEKITRKIVSNDAVFLKKLFVTPSAKMEDIKEVFNYE